jgi:Raf kinase inhibitor-like YbhB/YbcL family protein
MKILMGAILLSANTAFAAGFTLKSEAFKNQEDIPAQFTCEGEGISPALSWSGAPQKTKSFALIVDDPDAPDPAKPGKVFSHWVVYNIPPHTKSFAEGIKTYPAGTQVGVNEEKKPEYIGPCPPVGKHRYFFKIYALDKTVHFIARPTQADLEKEFVGHILAQSELIGLYAKRSGN